MLDLESSLVIAMDCDPNWMISSLFLAAPQVPSPTDMPAVSTRSLIKFFPPMPSSRSFLGPAPTKNFANPFEPLLQFTSNLFVAPYNLILGTIMPSTKSACCDKMSQLSFQLNDNIPEELISKARSIYIGMIQVDTKVR